MKMGTDETDLAADEAIFFHGTRRELYVCDSECTNMYDVSTS